MFNSKCFFSLTLNYLIFSLLSISSLYAQKNIITDSTGVSYLRVDPSNSMGGNVSDFFSEAEYIPLETNKESLFGSIMHLEIAENRYFILDDSNHYLLIFNGSGKFLAKIGNATNYLILFALNKFTKQIEFSNDNGKTLTYCDFDGKVLKKAGLDMLESKDKTTSSSLIFLGPEESVGNHYYNDVDTNSKDYRTFSKSLIHYANSDRKVYAQGLPFTRAQANLDVIQTGLGPLSPGDVDTLCFYSKPFDYSIYELSPKNIKLKYKLIFPSYSAVRDGFTTDTTLDGKRHEWFEKHPDEIYCISNFFRTGDNLLFKTSAWSSSEEDNLIYNVKSGSLIAFKHIQQDQLSSFLPIYDDTGGRNGGFNGILACKKEDIYVALSSLSMFKFYEANSAHKNNYIPSIASYFKNGSRKENPVILRLKLKKEL